VCTIGAHETVRQFAGLRSACRRSAGTRLPEAPRLSLHGTPSPPQCPRALPRERRGPSKLWLSIVAPSARTIATARGWHRDGFSARVGIYPRGPLAQGVGLSLRRCALRLARHSRPSGSSRDRRRQVRQLDVRRRAKRKMIGSLPGERRVVNGEIVNQAARPAEDAIQREDRSPRGKTQD